MTRFYTGIIIATIFIVLGLFRWALGFKEPWSITLDKLKPKHPDEKL